MDIDKDLLRWVLLIGATPIWLPFIRILWRDFNHALRDEGGLIGAPPRGREAERLRAEKVFDRDRLQSEPILGPKDRVTRRMQSPGARKPQPGRGPLPNTPQKPVGFKNSRSRGRG
ncbi:MAG: hypothetical protein SGI72_11370 [Planctomycetota bacterium]|nr:hypothetical protein [Planctomycetota bacterium]